MPEITITVTPRYNEPVIRMDAENDSIKIIQVVDRVMPDGRVWDSTEYTFWEHMPAEKEVPVYDTEGRDTGTVEKIPNPYTWYPLSKTHATNLKNIIAAIKSALDPVEAGKITEKSNVEAVKK